jgi:hypothetical protein
MALLFRKNATEQSFCCTDARARPQADFGEVCGYDVENLADKLKKLAEFYGVDPAAQSVARPAAAIPPTPRPAA